MSNFKPDWATEISEHLAEIMETRNLSSQQLALASGYSVEFFDGVLAGRPISAEEAEALERATGLKVYIWLALQDRAGIFRLNSGASSTAV